MIREVDLICTVLTINRQGLLLNVLNLNLILVLILVTIDICLKWHPYHACCAYLFISPSTETQTDDKKENTCHFCWKLCSSPEDLSTHLQTHLAEKPYKCIICPAEFNQEQFLIRHIKSHTGADTVVMVPFKCSQCQQQFSAIKDYNEHKQTCLSDNEWQPQVDMLTLSHQLKI